MMFQIVHAFEITKLYICIPISKKILRKLQSKIKFFFSIHIQFSSKKRLT